MPSESNESPRRTPSDREIPSLLESLEAAGGNTAAFARERGLAPWKLYKARRARAARRSREREREAEEEFVRVELVEERQPRSAPLELMLDGGGRLVIPADFDEAALRRVLGVLRSC